MNKKMRELLTKIQTKTAEAKALNEGENKDVTKASAIMDEVDALQKEFELEKKIFEAEKATGAQNATAVVADHVQEKKEVVTGETMIAKQVRAILNPGKFGTDKSLVESVDADGGYTVPEDIQTQVNHWPEIVDSLLSEIEVVPVSTIKGSRTYQKKADTEAFIDIDENGEITKEITAPQFERITYAIQNRAGFMPVSNDLVNDSDANIMGIVTQWLGRANIATANAKILEIINAKAKVAFDGIAGIKHAVNVTLGQAYKHGIKIITNDDGLDYLDNLVDQNGRPLLNADPTDSAKLQLRCGTVVVPIKVLQNKTLASDGTKIPFIVGDLKQGIRKYDRQSMSLMASNVAVLGNFNAFAMNMTLIRAILRDDYKALDNDAYVYGYIDTSVAGE
jgi:HK97 family phage major capsid protein